MYTGALDLPRAAAVSWYCCMFNHSGSSWCDSRGKLAYGHFCGAIGSVPGCSTPRWCLAPHPCRPSRTLRFVLSPWTYPHQTLQVAISLVGFTTVALKIHKYVLVGGSWSSAGAAAVISEDMALFVAVFGLWYMSKRVSVGVKRVWPLAVTRLLWGAIVGLTLVALAFLGIEHLYFCSTG